MTQLSNKFLLKALIFKREDDGEDIGSSWETVISSSTAADALAKLAETIENPSNYNAYFSEILGFSLYDNGKHLMDIDANHSTYKLEINWRRVEFFNVNRDLIKALSATFPEQAALLKSLALDESLGL